MKLWLCELLFSMLLFFLSDLIKRVFKSWLKGKKKIILVLLLFSWSYSLFVYDSEESRRSDSGDDGNGVGKYDGTGHPRGQENIFF